MIIALISSLLMALVVSAVLWLKRRDEPQVRRLMRAITPILLWSLAGGLAFRILQTPLWPFNGTRLAPALGLTRGYGLYYPRNSGPVLETTYGPVTALFYLPTWVTHTPNLAVLLGSAMTAVFCLTPLLFLTLMFPRRRSDYPAGLFGFLICGLMVLYCEPLRYSCINVHADGPALAFGGGSCLCLLWRRRSRVAVISAAVLAAVSPWSKQTALPILAGLVVYLVLVDGWRKLARFLLFYTVAALVIASTFFATIGPGLLWFNLVTVQSKVILFSSDLVLRLFQSGRSMMAHADLIVVGTAAALLSAFLSGDLRRRKVRTWVKQNDWTLLLLVGFFEIPIALLARAKTGGDINSFSFVLYYFNAAVGMIAAQVMRHRFQETSTKRPMFGYQVLALAATILLTAVELPTAFGIPRSVHNLADTEQQVGYRYLVRHPGSAYFPWLPLSHIMAEGRVYHSAFGIADRELSGNRVSDQHFRSGIPTGANFIAFKHDGIDNIFGCDLRSYIPEFTVNGTISELPGWTVLSRPSQNGYKSVLRKND